MPFDPNRHDRRSIRFREYDYTLYGSYFITICTYQRECLFGSVIDGAMRLNRFGEIAREEWLRSGRLRPEMSLDAFVVMPNHLHFIITVVEPAGHVGAHGNAPSSPGSFLHRSPRSIATFVSGFKGAVTRRTNALRDTNGTPIWQRNYFERVIRDETEYERIRAYIDGNPQHWAEDEYNPSR